MKRRSFLHRASTGTILTVSGGFPLHALSHDPEITKLTILHTNDVHSRIDPFPMDGSPNQGKGGAAKRAKLIKMIRGEEKNVLLFDCGDIFQGTPYFNFYKGELEIKLMSQMGYDASTLGNHDFDAGIDGFNNQLPHANFPFIVSNYNFDNTALAGKINKHKIFQVENMKIGVVGAGIKLTGLVPPDLYGETQYLDPIAEVQKEVDYLKNEQNCDYIVCLSHLGYKYKREPDKVSDVILARKTRHINLILGGHTHTFMREPDKQKNLDGKPVLINQCGWGGLVLGRIEIWLEKNNKGRCISCQNQLI